MWAAKVSCVFLAENWKVVFVLTVFFSLSVDRRLGSALHASRVCVCLVGRNSSDRLGRGKGETDRRFSRVARVFFSLFFVILAPLTANHSI